MGWIGIDLGTQSVRAVLIDPGGVVLARAARPLTSVRDGVRHEQDPQAWLTAVDSCLAELPASVVEGIAICSTSGTFLLTDLAGRPVTPALMYDDARSAARRVHIVDADPDRWAVSMQPTWALPKVLDLIAEGDDRRVVHSADFVAAHLIGHPVATDTSHALKTGYDLVADAWPVAAFEKLGLPTAAFPAVVHPGAELGRTPTGVPVYAGMTDGCAAQIAAGALSPGAWNSVLGTTLVLKGVSTELLDDPTGAVYSHLHPDGGWLPGGASSSGAGVLNALLPGADLAGFDEMARPVSAAIYPLTTPGERFPFVAPAASRFTIGRVETALDTYVAVLQGLAFVERLAFEHLAGLGAEPVRSVSLTGGATRSAYWNQLRADVLGVPVQLPAVPDPAYGMAVLAASAGGSVTETARRMVRVDRVLEPRPSGLDGLYAAFVAELDARGYRS
ncbi:carbohydrate kinase [Kribbella sandramycini]|uniref:Carbohydrate kinase n=1 Tax=Kribbella sandramycini TaxID=60450 RepID=A0A7Y4NZ96_9ACTN|nr:FGGY-family carbohydrate kinase [Kribbella sandramycini]MBB6565105.1 sugar (pentulose or hexulose) kinase [Kribbella sandramycini]NOL41376.1 carbohydrate kinase [Kribbella sandramycini]